MTRFLSPFALPIVLGIAGATAFGCTPTTPRTESDPDSCSNGRDDDGDTLVDCRDPACTVFPFCSTDAGMRDAGVDATPFDAEGFDAADAPPTCTQPLDVVFVLDVSSTMEPELTAFRDAMPAIWASALSLDPTAQLSLVAFVDDVLVMNDCAGFATADDMIRVIDGFRVSAPMNRNVVNTTLVNQDCAENSLDALYDAATMCPFRTRSARVMIHATDDTFVERPGVLSGEWGGGVFVASTYAEVVTAMVSRSIHLGALSWSGAGEFCGAGTSPDTGQGFHTSFGGQLALPQLTAGVVWDGRALRGGTLDLAGEVSALFDSVHSCE